MPSSSLCATASAASAAGSPLATASRSTRSAPKAASSLMICLRMMMRDRARGQEAPERRWCADRGGRRLCGCAALLGIGRAARLVHFSCEAAAFRKYDGSPRRIVRGRCKSRQDPCNRRSAMNIRVEHGVRIVALALCATAGRAQTTYTVTHIGTLGGPSSMATALNNNGTVVGISNTSNAPTVSRAFRWLDGVMIDLETLGGPSAEAFDVNDAGQITGRAETIDSIPFNEITHAFIWHNGAMLDLGTTGGDSSRGWAINA